MKKLSYSTPELELISFAASDIIRTSNLDNFDEGAVDPENNQ